MAVKTAAGANLWFIVAHEDLDSVDSFLYDPNFQRIAITSHYGKIKVYSLGRETGNLAGLWTHEVTETIPRAVFFGDHGNSLSVYAMEGGTIHSYDSETSTEKSVTSLKTAIGNVDVCTNTGHFVIDNMFNGFDLYSPNRTSPIHTFKVEITARFIKTIVFGEGGQIIVAGSDHGKVYLFGTGQKDVQQVLRHGNRDQIIQVVATKSTKTEHIVVSGASSGNFGINVWKKVESLFTQVMNQIYALRIYRPGNKRLMKP
ncbi:hypothetical protein CPB84DRAFT_1852107 [Gymnopilus junonius]|uniref:Uncharacterized protein n=1 Tax=Gymnopilus junonius TaxID=109634 RepID=A0A9P5NCY3_GYMJU|nr:hypothetical protein CPB84DRAFT_1852107 [Gymnopilus junonius]